MNLNNKINRISLAVRFRIANILFIFFILLAMILVSAFLIYRMADNASKDYVRFYTKETVDILGANLIKEISLVQFAATSREIIEWFADEENPGKKFTAYQKMMHFAGMQQINGLYFAIKSSGNEYSISKDASFEDFKPYHVLRSDTPFDRWFYDAIDADYDYILKLDTVKSLDSYNIWIDHKVVKDGNTVGVFSSGIPFENIYEDLYGEYDNKKVIGYLIDNKGIIQMDSSVPDAGHILSSDEVYDPKGMRHVLDVKSNYDFASFVNQHLAEFQIHNNLRVDPGIIKLSDDNFRYVAVASVPYTNWLAITLYNSDSLLNFMSFLPPVIVIVLAFLVYVLGSNLLIHRLVFLPLEHLTASVAEASHDSSNIFGIERNDEIGALARVTSDAWIRLSDNAERLLYSIEEQERQTRILHAVNAMAAALFSVEDDVSLEKALPDGLKLLADCMDIDRISIFRNDMREDGLYYILLHQWVSPMKQHEKTIPLKSAVFNDNVPLWKEKLSRNEYICSPVKMLPDRERAYLNDFDVKAIFVFPVYLNGEWWGFVSFDCCRSERILPQEDLDILHAGSLIMASAINRGIQAAALREIHEYANIMLDTMPMACMLWNDRQILFDCNKKALEFFGINDKEELGRKFSELSPEYQPDGRNSNEIIGKFIGESLEKGKVVFKWIHQNSSGDQIPAEITIVRVNLKGEMLVASFIRDLREQNKMLFEIEQRDILLQTVNNAASLLLNTEIAEFEVNLYKSMSMMARAVNADRVYIWRNNLHNGELCVTQIYEWLEESIAPQSKDYTVNMSYEKIMPDWYEALFKGQCVNGMARDMGPASRNLMAATNVLSIFLSPIFVQSNFWGFVGFDDCHSERVFSANEAAILSSGCLLIGNAFLRHSMTMELKSAAEEAKAANNSKSVFLANMSHEIRTPMNSVIGFSELALDGDVPSKTREYLNKILSNSEWLMQIINDILDISKIESGKMELENIPFNMHELFSSCRTVIMPKAIEKGLSMHFYAEPSIGKKLFGDPTRLRQVLVNLISNAIKFTNSGLIKMQSSISAVGEDSVTMLFEIRDSGIGISQEQIKKIFDPFTQAESGTTRKFGGSGLGLPISKNIIEMMGGTLNVESTPGVGSKFSFEITFDAVAMDEDTPSDIVIFDDMEKPTFEGEVLLCEDNEMNQQVICEHLARVGLKTEIAQNGKIGVDLIKKRAKNGEKQYDLIFMDIHMPVMDGLEAASKIFEFDPGIPIVAMTANVMKNDKEIYISRGMSDCVGKPFTSQVLWRCLMKYFKPVRWQKENNEESQQHDNELRRKLVNNFVKNNNGKFEEITDAINAEDVKLAHRLVHTLKSNAGQLDKKLLQKAAEEIENYLKTGKLDVNPRMMDVLKKELNDALADLTSQIKEIVRPVASKLEDVEAARILLDKLEVLLNDSDAECLSYVDKLHQIPGSEDLMHQIENFDFAPALETLAGLKKKVFE